ncbi:MAG TPA: DUF1302 family protein, partial [Kofleriaceae bacterium]|nr:DUF1302 family protein [Kofleriaceae bacterium]
EMYVGVFSDYVGLRIGNQRIAWGKGDVISPNDVLNPRDLRDPLLTDTELRHIPTFAVRADIQGGSNALQLVFQPFFVPDRYDVYGSNWAAIQPDSPLAYRGFFHLIDQLFDSTLHDQVQRVFAQTSLPTKPSAGARYTVTGHNVDASLYYHYGYDASPKVTLDPMFAGAIGSVDWTMATPTTLAPVLGLLDMGVAPYSVEFQRRHHIGVDGVTTIGSFALKIDAAYDTKHVYYQPDLVSFVSPAAQAVVSLEYQTGEIGKLLLLEGVYNRIMDTPPMIGLLGYNKDTEGVALLARWTFFDVIETEVRAVYEDSPHTTVFQPQLAYRARSGGLSIGAGALFIKGEGSSLGAYYGRNDSVYGLVKYAF